MNEIVYLLLLVEKLFAFLILICNLVIGCMMITKKSKLIVSQPTSLYNFGGIALNSSIDFLFALFQPHIF
jgi:hypothetical protein